MSERAVAAALIALIPAVLTYALVHLLLGGQINDFVPSVWNDQTAYWHRILSFGDHGLSSGYYLPDENLAQLSDVNRFGTNGPAFPIAYGVIAWVIGWGLTTSIYVNAAVLGGALAAFVWFGRLDRIQIALVALLAVFFGPLALYLPTASQETLQQSIAIVLALFFSGLLARGADLPRNIKVAGLTFIVCAGFIRFSWALMLVPAILLAYPPADWRRLLAEIGIAGAITCTVLVLFNAMNPPGQNSILDTFGAFPDDPGGTISTVLSDAWENVKLLYDPNSFDTLIPESFAAISLQAWLVSGLLLLSIGFSARLLIRRDAADPERDRLARREWLFHVYNLGTIFAGAIMLYLPPGYYRVLGANLLLSLLVMVKSRRIAPVAVVLAASVAMLPSFFKLYEVWKPNFEFDVQQIEADREEIARNVRYQDDADTPWCNTLLLSLFRYDYRVTEIPAGIGVSSIGHVDTLKTVDMPLQSRYVVLGGRDRALAKRLDLPLEPVAELSIGTLFENPESPCTAAG